MTTTAQLTPVEVVTHRSAIYGAKSVDGAWTYYSKNGRVEVTHQTGRRFWATDLDRGRQATADAGFVAALLAAPPAGTPLNRAELDAICGELDAADVRQMMELAAASDVDVKVRVADRITARLQADIADWRADEASKAARTVYRIAPTTWLSTLRQVRPDLVPPRMG
ncbi:hypothetical protein BJF79_13660 [Actinomadura sp. CNU-125]|uniref:hypothetical protein n=1 Tax=Actinomadura sp. CNU-125 TaxID=1904961 RepID=UPI000960FB3C|nr:hypothetical protein [Actinomadura sp. CNU-125]OLT24384.1 hypothetical protein BJF79_13660 [Actinomadura sp. CNU-125]